MQTIFMNYKDGFNVTILNKTIDGIIPYNYKNPSFIKDYPYLARKLKEGKILYVKSDSGYLGNEINEGPYAEEKIFLSEYENKNIDFKEIIINLDKDVKGNKKVLRRLMKIGDTYEKDSNK